MEIQNEKIQNEKIIKQHYKWFIEHCIRFKKNTIPYTQFKKEFIKNRRETQTEEEQKRLKRMSKILKEVKKLI